MLDGHGVDSVMVAPDHVTKGVEEQHLLEQRGKLFGDVHHHVRKTAVDGRTRTIVERLADADRLGEVTAMLGAASDAGRLNAAELLAATAAWKDEQRA